MTLSCDKPFSTNKYGPGIFVNKATIVDAVDISGQAYGYMQNPCDIGIVLVLDIGRDFQPELIIGGLFKRDVNTGEVVAWGSAFIVQEALSRLGFTGRLDPGNKIPKAALSALKGRPILRLSYVSGTRENGKLKYSDWSQIGVPESGESELVGRFRKSLSRGFPKNYRPELVDAGVPLEPTSAPLPSPEVDDVF